MKVPRVLSHQLIGLTVLSTFQLIALEAHNPDIHSSDHRSRGLTIAESKSCLAFNSAAVQSVVINTSNDCNQNICVNGCCRLLETQQLLVCDQENLFPYHACVCNALTAPAPSPTMSPDVRVDNLGPTPAISISFSSATNFAGPSPVPVSGPTGPTSNLAPTLNPTPTPALVTARSSSAASECKQGSVWQTAGFHFQNCFGASDCQGVIGTSGQQTCCRKSFCWCDAFVDYEDCVPAV